MIGRARRSSLNPTAASRQCDECHDSRQGERRHATCSCWIRTFCNIRPFRANGHPHLSVIAEFAFDDLFPSYVTCWRRFVEWSMSGVWDRAWLRLVSQLDDRGVVDWEQGFADGTFASAKKGEISSSHQARQGVQAHGLGGWTRFAIGRWRCCRQSSRSDAHRAAARTGRHRISTVTFRKLAFFGGNTAGQIFELLPARQLVLDDDELFFSRSTLSSRHLTNPVFSPNCRA